MGYQIVPNVVFVLSVCGIILIVLKNLPKAISESAKKTTNTDIDRVGNSLAEKGLPILNVSKLKSFFKFWGQKIWNFALEAKDLRHASATGYKIKKIVEQNTTVVAKKFFNSQKIKKTFTEDELVEKIKADPKNLKNYDDLGQLYLDQENFTEAKDIFLYLTKHESGNADFFARLAFSCYKLKSFEEAENAYEKSLALDSTHPNRYYNLGLTKKALGKNQDAIEAFQKALLLEPENIKYKTALANLKV